MDIMLLYIVDFRADNPYYFNYDTVRQSQQLFDDRGIL